jgi:thiol-disulfide isomerase/thioredoxin
MKTVFIACMVLILSGCYGTVPEKTGMEGKPVPSFKMLLPDSVTYFDTQKIPNDKPFVVFLFGAHCPYSRAQMEEIVDDHEKLKGLHFYVLAYTSFSDMKQFYNDFHLSSYKNITVGVDTSQIFINTYEIDAVPYIAVYGKDKKLKEAYRGQVFSKQLLRAANE